MHVTRLIGWHVVIVVRKADVLCCRVVLGKAHNVADIRAKVTGKCDELASRGLRSLGIARAIGEVTDGEQEPCCIP